MILGRRELAILQKLGSFRRRFTRRVLDEARVAHAFADPSMHEHMLLDDVRCSAYREAIHRTVKSGDVVADLGAGTGILSFFAAEAGAKRVYAIEMSGIADIAAELIEANGLQDRIVLIRDNSMKVRLPERCDVVVTETLSTFCFDENIPRYVEDARRRFLKPDGHLIPEACETLLQPFSSDAIGIGRMPERLYGFDFRPFRRRNSPKPRIVYAFGQPLTELADSARCHNVRFGDANSVPGPTVTPFVIHTPGRLDGFLGWFEAQLCPGVTLSTSHKLPGTWWGQFYFPVMSQPQVSVGQKILFHLDPRTRRGPDNWEHRVVLMPSC